MMENREELAKIGELLDELRAGRPSGTFLTAKELVELTGRRAHKLQIETLRKQGLPFFLNAAGKPIVPRSAIDGKSEAAAKLQKKTWTPPD